MIFKWLYKLHKKPLTSLATTRSLGKVDPTMIEVSCLELLFIAHTNHLRRYIFSAS